MKKEVKLSDLEKILREMKPTNEELWLERLYSLNPGLEKRIIKELRKEHGRNKHSEAT